MSTATTEAIIADAFRTMPLTRTQKQALAALKKRGSLYPAGRGFWRGDNHTPWERRTLQALVNAGHARWNNHPGLMPCIVPADTPEPAPRPVKVSPAALAAEWIAEANRLDDARGEEYAVESEIRADTLRECAEALARLRA